MSSSIRHLTIVYGTRPEAIKLRPIVQQLVHRNIPHTVISTGQHTTLLHGTGLTPHRDLGFPATGDPIGYADDLVERLFTAFPDDGVVLVQGDTASAYAAALAAHAKSLPVLHVECGVRTGDLTNPWPEEGFRIGIDRRSTIGYAAHPQHAAQALETNPHLEVHVTGNPGVDACLGIVHPRPLHQRLPLILVTLHRRESFGEPLHDIVLGLLAWSREHPDTLVRWPVHPNPQVQRIVASLASAQSLECVAPMPHATFVHQLATCTAVLTDSGGVQEDAATLGIPCVIARHLTDRPETVESGHAVLAGRTRGGIIRGLLQATGLMMRTDAFTGYGLGCAAQKIANHLAQWL